MIQQYIFYQEFTSKLILALGMIILILFLQKFILSVLTRKIERSTSFSFEIINDLKVLLRIFLVLITFYLVFILFDLSLESIFGLSAIVGAIISFSSVEWISNFISGIYILLVHPFGLGDFIEISEDIRGEVFEISINYTKIRTYNDIQYLIPNRTLVNANLVNYNVDLKELFPDSAVEYSVNNINKISRLFQSEKLIRYTFNWSVPIGDILETKEKISQVCKSYSSVFGYTPEFFIFSLGYRIQFKFVLLTSNSQILMNNIRNFRNELISAFY